MSERETNRIGQAIDSEILERWQTALIGNRRATVFSFPDWLVPRHETSPLGSHFIIDLGSGIASCSLRVRHRTRTIYLDGADYTDIVATPGEELACVTALLEELRTKRRLWDVCDFRSLAPFSAILNVFAPDGVLDPPRELRHLLKGMIVSMIPHSAYSYVNLPGSWEVFEGTLSSKMASQLRAEKGRRERNFGSNEIRLATPASFDKDIDAFIELHQKRWIEKGHHGLFSNPDIITRVCRSLIARNALLLYTLWLDDEPAGGLLCFDSGDRILHYASGFDTRFRKFRPVKVLIARAIQDGISSGKYAFDFMKGDEPYKEEWANAKVTNYRVLIARKNLMGAAATVALRATSKIKNKGNA